MLNDDYPALWHFMGAYLHQDWRDEYGGTSDAFSDFLDSEPAFAALVVAELNDVLESRTSDEIERLMVDLGSSYLPSRSGQDASEWLAQLRAHANGANGTH